MPAPRELPSSKLSILDKVAPATQVKKKIKALFWGPAGTGKSLAALSFPGVVAVDAEGSLDLYDPGREVWWGTIPHYDVIRTKSPQDLIDLVEAIKGQSAEVKGWETLVVDPISVFWLTLQESGVELAEGRARRKGWDTSDISLTQKDWGWIKRRLYSTMTDMVSLPVNVVFTAHLRDIMETRKDNKGQDISVKVGEKADAEKKIDYWPDVIFRMEVERVKGKSPRHYAICEKDRTGLFYIGQEVDNLQYATFAPFLQAHDTGQEIHHPTETAAILQDAQAITNSEAERTRLRLLHKSLGEEAQKYGVPMPKITKEMSNEEVNEALTEVQRGVNDAKEKIAA